MRIRSKSRNRNCGHKGAIKLYSEMGEQCFRELRQLNPAVKVIMSSGYNEQDVTEKFVGKGLAGFIQKPYRISALREVLSSIK